MLNSLSKNRVKTLQKLNQKKYRDLEKLYLISGLRGVKSALENNPASGLEIIITNDKSSLLTNLFFDKSKIPVYTVSEKEFQSLSQEQTPQGICLVAQKPETNFDLDLVSSDRFLFIQGINDPGNLGTIIRSAAWFGFNTLLLSRNSADPFQPKVVRSTAGAINSLYIFENIDAYEIIQIKNKTNCSVYSTHATDGVSLEKVNFENKMILMFGSEAQGLSAEFEELNDQKISISRLGKGESLNLANAVSIMLYQATLK